MNMMILLLLTSNLSRVPIIWYTRTFINHLNQCI
nr:MAG TPA: hypothetical protein [Caudoviricetes sp.]